MKQEELAYASDKLKEGGIGIFPTDTLYGVVGSALDPEAVQRIYEVKKRNPEKPLIVLVGLQDDLKKFGIFPTAEELKIIDQLWPGKVSIILPCKDESFDYLTRGTGTISFRYPAESEVSDFLKATGPLVAPSANPEGLSPAGTIEGARKYFGTSVDFYVDAGKKDSEPSTLVKFEDGEIHVLREGAVKI